MTKGQKGRSLGQRKEYNLKILFDIYTLNEGNVQGMVNYIKRNGIKDVPLNEKTIKALIKELGFKDKAEKEAKKIIGEDFKQYRLEKKEILAIVKNSMIQYANKIKQGGGAKTAQEFKILWEIMKVELGEPTTITENTNKNLDLITFIDSITDDPTDTPEETGSDAEPEEIAEGYKLLTAPRPTRDS